MTVSATRLARYSVAVVAVISAFVLKLWLIPLTGTGAPFVLFFAAVMGTSLVAGVGAAVVALFLSVLLGGYIFVIAAGYRHSEAAFQSLLFLIDGSVVIYLALRMQQGRQLAQDANRQLRLANEEVTRAEARRRELLELAPDTFFQADLNARLTDVNQATCRLLGYTRDELVGKTIFDIIPDEDASRLKAVRQQLLVPGHVERAEWLHKRKDGTLVPLEVSANILPDGRWQAFGRDISERKRIEDERHVFVAFLENSSDFIGIADPDGKPIYLNPAGRRMVGLPADYSVERTQISEYYPPEQRAFAADVILRSMIDKGRWEGETYFRHWQTQEPIPVSDAHFLIRDPQTGRTLGMGTITRDISVARRFAIEREQLLVSERAARERAEAVSEQLRESEERFRLIIDEAPIGMALIALDGRFVRVNRALCEIVGYRADELTALTIRGITHPDDVEASLAQAKQLACGETARYQLDKRYIHKDGSTVDVRLNVSVLRDHAGLARYFISQIEDITDRKRAENALRFSEAKLSGIISIAADAIISVDERQKITIFNEGAERIFGYGSSEIIGTPLETLIPERFRAAHHSGFTHFATGEELARNLAKDIYGLRRNGQEFPAEASISKVIVDEVALFSIVLRDITDRKAAAEALSRAVASRDEVLGIVAHDLRNPLTSIVHSVQLAQRSSEEPERLAKALGIVALAAGRMNQLIQGLLDVSLIEAGQLKLDCERICASDLVREAVDMQTPLASSSGLALHAEVAQDAGVVWGNSERLHQVFENLIGNAIKFTEAGGRIVVGATPKGADVQFWVTDSGHGISPENLAHVFDRFWQAVPRAGRVGAGLGLAITKGIVQAHGGRIWAESTVSRGSTFFFTIPRPA